MGVSKHYLLFVFAVKEKDLIRNNMALRILVMTLVPFCLGKYHFEKFVFYV